MTQNCKMVNLMESLNRPVDQIFMMMNYIWIAINFTAKKTTTLNMIKEKKHMVPHMERKLMMKLKRSLKILKLH